MFLTLYIQKGVMPMTLIDLIRIWYALKTVYPDPDAKRLFIKLLHNLKITL